MIRGLAYLIGTTLTLAGVAQSIATLNVDGLTVLLCGTGLTLVGFAKRSESRA
jgi:hypothetical protein